MNVANDNKAKAAACPICRKPAVEAYHPFCSKRCADVDLARWLGGGYAIPAAEEDDPDAEDASPAPRHPRSGEE